MSRNDWRAVASTLFDLAIYMIIIYALGELFF
jgi:hypothetical protein